MTSRAPLQLTLVTLLAALGCGGGAGGGSVARGDGGSRDATLGDAASGQPDAGDSGGVAPDAAKDSAPPFDAGATCPPPKGSGTAFLRANQIGYRPTDAKHLRLMTAGAQAAGSPFTVLDGSCKTVLSAPLGADLGAWATALPHVYDLDVSALTQPGRYTVSFTSGSTTASAVITVGPGRLSMRRCSTMRCRSTRRSATGRTSTPQSSVASPAT